MMRIWLLLLVLVPAPLLAQTKKPAPATAPTAKALPQTTQTAKPAAPQAGGNLESVLNSMDRAAASFKALTADFEWTQYTKVVDESEVQKGTIFFRKTKNGIEMAADINYPKNAAKYVLFTNGIAQIYEPKISQITKYDAGKNRAAFESFLVLGFGSRGHDLEKSFDVKYAGTENLGGTQTAKLELTPKSDKVRNMFATIMLWVDTHHGYSIQQKFNSAGGDYKLSKYSNFRDKAPESAFELKVGKNVTIVSPQR